MDEGADDGGLPAARVRLDPVYLATTEYGRPKEAFRVVRRLIEERHAGRRIDVLDVGCATGAFLHHLLQTDEVEVGAAVGADLFAPFLEQARAHVPGAEFVERSLLDLEGWDRTFDVCTCLGTLNLFDDLEEPLRNLLSRLRPGGALVVWDVVNDDAVDLLVRWRHSDREEPWQRGWNLHSMATWTRLLAEIAPGCRLDAADFRMPMPIPKGEDPMRSWTVEADGDPHRIVVGTGQMLPFKVLHVAL